MDEPLLPSALVGELLEVLQDAETFISRASGDHRAVRIVDGIMRVRARLLRAVPTEGVYSANLLRAILQNAVDAIIITDERGAIEIFNPAAERMFGYSADEVIGQPVTILRPPDLAAEYDQTMKAYLRTREPHVMGIGREVVGSRKDGSAVSVHLALCEINIGARIKFAGFLRELGRG